MNSQHVHAQVIIAWARGAVIQQRLPGHEDWEDVPQGGLPSFSTSVRYRVKPGANYPKTTMTGAELIEIYVTAGGGEAQRLTVVANAALRHALDTRQIVAAT